MENKTYQVIHCQNDGIIVTGKAEDKAWENAHALTDFVSPWGSEEIKKIEFKALWNAENLYFSFRVYDAEVHIDTTDDGIESIGNSDRVELFFRSNEAMSPYYCLEIDPSCRLMDFKAYPGRKFDFNWHWPKGGILLKSDIQKDHFTVEGAIGMDTLQKLNLVDDHKIETGIFRAKYHKSEGFGFKPTWISWVPPQSNTPDFHIPSSFGTLLLME